MASAKLGRGDLLLLVVNVVVGAGVVALPGRAYAASGSLIYVALGTALASALVIAGAFAVLARRFEGPGGPYLYAVRIWGHGPGAVVGWSLTLTRLLAAATSLKVCAEAIVTTGWSAAPQTAMIPALGLTCAGVALYGLALPIRLSNAVGLVKLLALGAIAALGLWCIARGPDVGQAPVATPHLAHAVLIWFYAFTGFESGTILAADARQPRRDLPFGMIAGLAMAGLLYGALTATSVSQVPTLASQAQPIVAFANVAAPAAGPIMGALLVLLVGATLPAQFAIAPRLISALAAERAAPAWLLAGQDGVSRPAVVLYAGGALAAALFGDITQLIVLSAGVRLLAYAVCCAGLGKLGLERGHRAEALLGATGALLSAALMLGAAAYK